ncbi:MAG: hypothetical protein ACWGN7_07330 [Thermodesulfovibrionales bacterium]
MFYFIDYSAPENVASHNLSSGGTRSGKFVQISKETDEYFVLAPRESASYHSEIVERFCLERGLQGSYDQGRKRFDLEAPGWVVQGGGKFEIDERVGRIRLYDQSMAYGKFLAAGLEKKLSSAAAIAGYTVHIE